VAASCGIPVATRRQVERTAPFRPVRHRSPAVAVSSLRQTTAAVHGPPPRVRTGDHCRQGRSRRQASQGGPPGASGCRKGVAGEPEWEAPTQCCHRGEAHSRRADRRRFPRDRRTELRPRVHRDSLELDAGAVVRDDLPGDGGVGLEQERGPEHVSSTGWVGARLARRRSSRPSSCLPVGQPPSHRVAHGFGVEATYVSPVGYALTRAVLPDPG